jgi:hypothetical protein
VSGILAIDQSLCTGWAHCEPGQHPQWGHKLMGRVAGDDDGEVIAAFDLFMCSIIERYSPRDLIFETPYIGMYEREDGTATKRRPVSAKTILMAGGWRALIIRACQKYDIRWCHQGTQAAVKLLTGHGKFPGATAADRRKAKKHATMAACWARGWKATEDEADALALLLFAESRLYPREAKERHMILKEPTGPLFA